MYWKIFILISSLVSLGGCYVSTRRIIDRAPDDVKLPLYIMIASCVIADLLALSITFNFYV